MKKRRSRSQRAEDGSSLATVLAISVVSSLWLTALFSAVLPSYQKVSKSRVETVLRANCEAALDWVVSQLQTPGSFVDDANWADQGPTDITLPTSVFYAQGSQSGMPMITGRARVWASRYAGPGINQPAPAPPNTPGVSGAPIASAVYDQRLVVPINPPTDTGWRVVTVETRVGTTGKIRRTLRVVMKPIISTMNNTYVPAKGMVADGSISISGGNMTTDSYDSSSGPYGGGNQSNDGGDIFSNGNVASGTPIDIGNGKIGGHVIVASSPMGDTTTTVANCGPNAVVSGGVMVNGLASPAFDNPGVVQGNNAPQPIQESMSQTPIGLPAVPTAPTTATSIAAINLGGKTSSQTLGPGDYIVPSISISGKGSLTCTGTATNPVRIWVQGANPSISIAGQGITNPGGVPAGLQIFYSGTTDVTVTGQGDWKGVLYAPNANVKIAGNGQYYGAMVGKSIGLVGGGNSGGFHYDRQLGNMNLFQFTTTTVTGKAIISWQELPQSPWP